MSERLISAHHASAGLSAGAARPRRLAARALVCPLGILFFSLVLTGCHHKPRWTPPPATALAPVELSMPPEAENPPQIASETPPVYEPPSPPPTAPRPVRRRPATPRETTPPQPGQSANAGGASATEPDNSEVAELAIGSLSSGGDTTPGTEQQARELIAAIKKRIAALPRSVASQQKSALRQVNNFLKHAQQALDSGDAEGALNLATKARLVMDDIEKK